MCVVHQIKEIYTNVDMYVVSMKMMMISLQRMMWGENIETKRLKTLQIYLELNV